MARERIHGADLPFCDWMRRNPTLPSSKFVATDCDLLIHAYKTQIDNCGTREIQCIQLLEVKTRSGYPSTSQQDTLWKQHATTNSRTATVNKVHIANFGVSFVRISGVRPDESSEIEWGRFNKAGSITWTRVSLDKLERLMLFECDPQTMEKTVRRRHHKTQEVYQLRQTELGFPVYERVVKRS